MTLPAFDQAGLFNVQGKSAIVVGATGAFGKVACVTLGRAGAHLTLAAGNAAELALVAEELTAAGVQVCSVARRPNTEADCEIIVDSAVGAFGGVDILVVASCMNDEAPITEMT